MNDGLGSLRSPPPRGSGPLPPERPRVRGPGGTVVARAAPMNDMVTRFRLKDI